MSILKRGLSGVPVKRMQEKLGIANDGVFGSGTEKAVKEFQQANNLAVDGIAGPDTFAAMGLDELVLLRVGSRGDLVKMMQQDLGVDADGKFGAGTKKAVMAFQLANGLTPDGMAGPETLAKMTSFKATYSPSVLKKANLKPDEESFESAPLPEIDGVKVATGSATETPPKKSIWGKIKGWL